MRRIVASLEEALDLMEEVQELVELAEDQKLGDEREIENLRRALRRIQVPPREQEKERRPEIKREEPKHEEPPHEPEQHEEPEDEDTGPEEQGS